MIVASYSRDCDVSKYHRRPNQEADSNQFTLKWLAYGTFFLSWEHLVHCDIFVHNMGEKKEGNLCCKEPLTTVVLQYSL